MNVSGTQYYSVAHCVNRYIRYIRYAHLVIKVAAETSVHRNTVESELPGNGTSLQEV